MSIDPIQKLKILIVDDDIICLNYLQNLLMKNYHCVIDAVSSPIKALDKINNLVMEWQPHWYDLVLIDIQMPILQGDALGRTIKDIIVCRQSKTLPIVVITSNLTHAQQRNLLQLGVYDILIKPVTKEMLDMVLDKYGFKTFLLDTNP